MGYAEVISLPEVRARKQWESLRQQLHERFDRWLDEVEAQLPASAPTLAQVSETIWTLRQQLTGGVAQTIVEGDLTTHVTSLMWQPAYRPIIPE